MTKVTPAGDSPQVNCGLIGVGGVGTAVLDFFSKAPLELALSDSTFGGPSSVPIHVWSASRRSRRNPRAASEKLIHQVVQRAGGEGPRFFYDYDPDDPSPRFTPGAPAWRQVVSDPNVDIVVELTGSPVAEAIIQEALWNGKCVVTANKKVISRTGYELVKLAQARGTVLAYEAAVGGGMPVVQMMGTSIGGRITAMQAILNGTTNFILSSMRGAARDPGNAGDGAAAYPSALCAATHAGLAEADPSDDVLGEDARSKLIILAGLAFGVRLRPRDLYFRGIARRGRRELPQDLDRAVFHACPPGQALPCKTTCGEDDHLATESIFTAADLVALGRLGYVPKLLAGAQLLHDGDEERIVAWVQPAALPEEHPLAGVEGSENACLLRVESPVSTGGQGDRSYQIMVRGPGAGGPETASSVIADIQFCARQLAVAGRLGLRGNETGSPAPVYTYGATAFSRAQSWDGPPSFSRANGLAAPFFLRFRHLGEAGHQASALAIRNALSSGGIEAEALDPVDSASGHLYYRTGPASVGALEQAIERALRGFTAAEMSLDVLYLPILKGVEYQ